MNLEQFGWNPLFAQQFTAHQQAGLLPARIYSEQKKVFFVYGSNGEMLAEVAGRMRHVAASRRDLPTVGDWVAVQPPTDGGPAVIQAILPRTSCFSRKVAAAKRQNAQHDEQVIAANVDTALIVCGLDRDFNLRRIERYLTFVYSSGATPIIVLNKADVCENLEAVIYDVEAIALGVPVHALAAKAGEGVEVLRRYLAPGKTVALLGSSGVGKSTIINALLGHERQRVNEISEHVNKGQHTTTQRELILVPGGGMIMDNPGMRELQLLGDESDLNSTFEEIEAFAEQCRFSNCRHDTEPGCAVKEALERGEIEHKRFRSYLKQQKELSFSADREEHTAQFVERKRWKQISQYQKSLKKRR